MKEKEYHLKIHSIGRFIIAFIVILILGILLVLDKIPRSDSEILSFIQFLSVFASSFYLAQLIGMGKAKIVFTNEGLVHKWERRFFLSWEKNFKIPWELIDNYVFQEDRTFDSFIINLTNKTRYKINKINILPIKDDFRKLVKDFPKLSNEFKNGKLSENIKPTILEGESIYASKSFRWVFYFMLTAYLVLLVSKLFNPNFETTWATLGVIGSGLLFYGLMISGHNKNNKC
jgi:hypothetical protein